MAALAYSERRLDLAQKFGRGRKPAAATALHADVDK